MPAKQTTSKSNTTRIEIPVLALTVDSFTRPDTIKETVIEKSSVSGERQRTRTIEKPFAAEITVDRNNDTALLRALGIVHKPERDLKVALSVDGGKLACKIDSTYKAKETRQRVEEYNRRWVEAEKFYYSWVPAHWESDTRTIDYEVEVSRAQRVNGKMETEAFQALYLGVEQAAKAGSPQASQLLSFFNKKFKEESAAAKLQMKEQIEQRLADMRSNVAELAKQLRQFSLPKGHR